MSIIKKYPAEMDAKQLYMMTKSKSVEKLATLKGKSAKIAAWVRSQDVNDKTGELTNVLAIQCNEGDRYATNSATFIRDFDQLIEIFGDNLPEIKIMGKKSMNGREYLICDIVE